MSERGAKDIVETRLWRYLDLAKFTSLLQTKKLHCPRGDQFEDKFEGSYPKMNQADFDGFGFNGEDWKKFVAVSCWHKNAYESDAMWRLYGLTTAGVAIVTTQDLLNDLAKENNCYVQKVDYKDFSNEKADIPTPTFAFHYKRKAFEHENEIRMIKTKTPRNNGFDNGLPIQSGPVDQEAFPKEGRFLELDLNRFIKKIIVSPYAQSWFYDVVYKLTDTCGVAVDKVSWSELYGDPIYAKP